MEKYAEGMTVEGMSGKSHIKGIIALFIAAASWGSAYAFTKTNMDIFTPEWLLAFRFGLAGIFMALIGCRHWKRLKKRQLLQGMWLGILLYGIFYFYTRGLLYTTASRASFIVGSYIMFVPFAYWIIRRNRPRGRDFLAAAVCLVGISLIVLDGSGGGLNRGDMLTFVCTLFYAVQVVYSAMFAREGEIFLLNMVQIGTAGVLAVVIAFLTGAPPLTLSAADLKGPLYLAVVGTMVPQLLSLYGQRHVRTTTSAIILSFESVFGCMVSILVLREVISLRFVIGAVIVLFAFVITEDVFTKKLIRREKRDYSDGDGVGSG